MEEKVQRKFLMVLTYKSPIYLTVKSG